jgi:hypothetical protein
MATTVAANPHKAPLRMQASIRSSGVDCRSAIAVPTALDGTHLGTTLARTQALALGSGGATSPLVAALAEAVIEQRVKRAGLVPAVVGNVVAIVNETRREPVHRQVREASSRLRDHGLQVVEGGRRARTEP